MNDVIKKLTAPHIKQFIDEHLEESVQELVLKYTGTTDLPIKEIAEQIECRNKAVKKLPELSKFNLLYGKVALEQASSELTASYKASRLSGKRIVDITGGLGIDTIYLSKNFEEVYYCEINEDLADLALYNFSQLGFNNIKVLAGDGIEFLKQVDNNFFDCVFVDPSRRDGNKRSVDIKYLKPDVTFNRELLLKKSKKVCIKLAPAFDISEAFREFPGLESFEVVSVNNECKEVLVFLRRPNEDNKQSVAAVMLKDNGSTNIYRALRENEYLIHFEQPSEDMFLYDPDVSIRKAGLLKLLAEQLKLCFINRLSGYLISTKNVSDFPGRKFRIIKNLTYNQKDISNYLLNNNITHANIARSNFPYKPEEIKKKLNLIDGGEDYLFFTKDLNQKLLFIHTIKTS
jgi:hypothetical protein